MRKTSLHIGAFLGAAFAVSLGAAAILRHIGGGSATKQDRPQAQPQSAGDSGKPLRSLESAIRSMTLRGGGDAEATVREAWAAIMAHDEARFNKVGDPKAILQSAYDALAVHPSGDRTVIDMCIPRIDGSGTDCVHGFSGSAVANVTNADIEETLSDGLMLALSPSSERHRRFPELHRKLTTISSGYMGTEGWKTEPTKGGYVVRFTVRQVGGYNVDRHQDHSVFVREDSNGLRLAGVGSETAQVMYRFIMSELPPVDASKIHQDSCPDALRAQTKASSLEKAEAKLGNNKDFYYMKQKALLIDEAEQGWLGIRWYGCGNYLLQQDPKTFVGVLGGRQYTFKLEASQSTPDLNGGFVGVFHQPPDNPYPEPCAAPPDNPSYARFQRLDCAKLAALFRDNLKVGEARVVRLNKASASTATR